MPLADRSDYEDARFCGVLVSRPSELEHEVDIVARGSGFDFVVTPLAATPERTSANRNTLEYPEFIREDFISHDGEWSSKLVGLVSQWLDLDSEDGELHRDSRAALQMEVSWAQFTGLQAVILPRPVIFTDALGYGQVGGYGHMRCRQNTQNAQNAPQRPLMQAIAASFVTVIMRVRLLYQLHGQDHLQTLGTCCAAGSRHFDRRALAAGAEQDARGVVQHARLAPPAPR